MRPCKKNISRIINTIASNWLQKDAYIFVLGRYLFLGTDNVPLLGTDNVRGQISVHIFAPNEGYCLSMIYL